MPRIRPETGMRIVHKGYQATIIDMAESYTESEYAAWVKLRFDAWWLPTRWVFLGGSVYRIASQIEKGGST
jgi:hypothetical protein